MLYIAFCETMKDQSQPQMTRSQVILTNGASYHTEWVWKQPKVEMDVDLATHPLWSASGERVVSTENARISRFGQRFQSSFMIEEASEPSSEKE